MKLVFVDETSDARIKDYFGLSCAIVDSSFYRQIKEAFQTTLISGGWNPEIEFKGAHIFSASKGDINVPVVKRVEIASKILGLNISDRNARMAFAYLKEFKSVNPRESYLRHLPALLKRLLPPAKKKNGKDVLSIQCDRREDIKASDVRDAVIGTTERLGYTLLEDIVLANSGFHTVGILYADIVGYLSARIDTIKADQELFENILPEHWETDGRLRKLKSSSTLLQQIKKLKRYKVVAK